MIQTLHKTNEISWIDRTRCGNRRSTTIFLSGMVLVAFSIASMEQFSPYSNSLSSYWKAFSASPQVSRLATEEPGEMVANSSYSLVYKFSKQFSSSPNKTQQPSEQPQDPIVRHHREAYTFTPNRLGDNPEELNIRSWGCERRQEAPLIFVHIGKAGGGSVRARLAASALNYNRSKWANQRKDKTYYYPMYELLPPPSSTTSDSHADLQQQDTTQTTSRARKRRGIFVNSAFNNFRPSFPRLADNFTTREMERTDKVWKSYEKTLPCSAETPLGQAIACPLVRTTTTIQRACEDSHCSVVYTGHNMLGNEMHWLPTKFLMEWWQSTPWSGAGDFMTYLQGRDNRWHPKPNDDRGISSACHYDKTKRPYFFYREHYFDCVAPWEEKIDQAATKALHQSPAEDEELISSTPIADWSPVYASLPVLRVTMIREPFSWLISKFFWHQALSGHLKGRNGTKVPLLRCDHSDTPDYDAIADWVSPAASKYMLHLCGEDCIVRLHTGRMTLEQAELQAQHNLQHSFAVVGLLNETDTFYDMVTARAAYMNASMNPEVTGGLHSTSKISEYDRCSQLYQSEGFQQNLLQASPELAALSRLYHIGVQVNRFQMREMQTCGLMSSD